jgi:hypothetical protein
VSALKGCRLLFPIQKIFARVYFWSSTEDAAYFVTWCGIVRWAYTLKDMLMLLGFYSPPPPSPWFNKFVHDIMFFVLCIVIQLCNAYTNGLPDDEHMMFKTCRRHKELN